MEKPELREFNNRDIGFTVATKEYDRLMLMYSRNNTKEITQTCSPVHVQSVMEDMQNVIVRLILEITKESSL